MQMPLMTDFQGLKLPLPGHQMNTTKNCNQNFTQCHQRMTNIATANYDVERK